MTTPSIMCGAESSLLIELGSPSWYENSEGCQSISPKVAFAYGSSSSLFGFAR